MISEVDICNLALTKIGTSTIVSFADETERARRLNIIFTNAKEQVLRDHVWNFSVKITTLALLSGETALGYEYVYSYPVNCLYIVRIMNADNTTVNDYKQILSSTNARAIASNTETAYIEYVMKIIDPNVYDSLFIDALANKLAAELSATLTGKESMATNFMQKYEIALAKAKRANAQEKHITRNITSPYLEAR